MTLFGLENEYTFFGKRPDNDSIRGQFFPPEKDFRRDNGDLLLTSGINEKSTWKEVWLKNGGRIYQDTHCLEYSSPECKDLRDLLRAQRVGEGIMKKVAESMDGEIEKMFVLKRNYSRRMNANWGSHENYNISDDDLFDEIRRSDESAESTIVGVHLLSRMSFTGSGHLQMLQRGDEKRLRFWISPRAYYVIDRKSNNNLVIHDLLQDSVSRERYIQRLHIVCGDMNRSDWSVYLKVGTMSAVLAYLQVANQREIESLANKLGIEYDMEMVLKSINLLFSRNGKRELFKEMIEKQRILLDVVDEKRDRIASIFEEVYEVLHWWDSILSGLSSFLEGCHTEWSRRLDWLIKKRLFERSLNKPLSELSSVSDDNLIKNVSGLDFNYHRVNRKDLFSDLVDQGEIESFLQDEDIDLKSPPKGRAEQRVRRIEKVLSDEDKNIISVRWNNFQYMSSSNSVEQVPLYIR